ncbi:hypothetical protein WDZ17_07645 [Pseudokineococcus basanitobsidens]|uniref:Uncharacterized protein n=1 Tax=Pseudokineococcus basanitobsidens TaxID=1926649 RepID=A0ABU8RJD6_9ACTN
MLSVVSVLASGEAEHEAVNELPFDSFFFGLIAFGALIAVLLVTYAFRSVGSRHRDHDGLHDGPHAAPHDAGARH